ncbi:MAG: type II toxin-antitoxin system prevent-host-death family antitoxin [Pseudomonadota bacterium]|nr:type II toxin-antitoxin system prevent-host-death family antitoxin [Pseudomonadota bacterium]
MSEVGIYEAKTHLPKLIERVQSGERITITKHGKPVAELIPMGTVDAETRRKAVDDLFKLRDELRERGVRITKDEIIAWKNEGRR